ADGRAARAKGRDRVLLRKGRDPRHLEDVGGHGWNFFAARRAKLRVARDVLGLKARDVRGERFEWLGHGCAFFERGHEGARSFVKAITLWKRFHGLRRTRSKAARRCRAAA